MRATIKEKREVAERTVLVIFDLGGEEVDYRPGQYFWVELPDRGYNDEKGLRRHISLVTSPTERGVLGFATRIRDSAFKRTLLELQVGDEVDIEEPKGSFVLPEDTSRPYVFVAGGIGITVFRSMLRYIADTGQPYRVTLVYSNRNRASAAFLDELEELTSRISGLDVVLVFTDEAGWEGETRHVDADVLRERLAEPLDAYTYMVAGPAGMAEDVGEKVRAAGVPEEQVVVGKFSGY
ncbi:MAG: ferredoxin--NADP reductase [Gaiellaceae bacterium]